MKITGILLRTAVLTGPLLATGCGTIKSKIYDVDNYTSSDRQVKCLKGIPETIEVPTHIKIQVTETRYFSGPPAPAAGSGLAAGVTAVAAGGNEPTPAYQLDQATKKLVDDLIAARVELGVKEKELESATMGQAALQMKVNELGEKIKQLNESLKEVNKYKQATQVLPTRSITYEVIRKKELYTVDFKRPASGTGDLKITYGGVSDGQYFKSVKQVTQDSTIADVGDLVTKVAGVLPKLKAIAETDGKAGLGLHGVTTVVAVQFFDVREPNLEGRIQAFLDLNVNACSNCCNSTPPTLTPACPNIFPAAPNPGGIVPGGAQIAPFPNQRGPQGAAPVVPMGYQGTFLR